MDQETHRQWWELHVRVARGEALSGAEQATYEAGLRDLEREEVLQPHQVAREARESLIALEDQRSQLERRRRELNEEIALLESRLERHTRRALGVEE